MRTPLSLACFATLALGASAALAKAPKPADETSVEDIFAKAEERARPKPPAAPVVAPLKDAIDDYRERKSPFADFARLTDCVDNVAGTAPSLRESAADALIARIAREDEKDAGFKAIRRAIGVAVLDLMKADKDPTGLRLVDKILTAGWKKQMHAAPRFSPKDPLADRMRAWAKMKVVLTSGDN